MTAALFVRGMEGRHRTRGSLFFAGHFAREHQKFVTEQGWRWQKEEFFVLPMGLNEGSIILAAHSFDAISKNQPDYPAAIVQAVVELPGQLPVVLSGDADDSVEKQANNVLDRCLRPGDTLQAVSSEPFDYQAKLIALDTPYSLRPFWFYSVTGGRLAGLLL